MKSSKYFKVMFKFFFVALAAMTWNEDSLLAGKTTWCIFLGSLEDHNRQLRISWGWIGNVHPLYISFFQGYNHFVTIKSKGLETTVYRLRRTLKFWWNSEHIARKYGAFNDNTDEYGRPIGGGPESWYEYNGWLGRHEYV